MNKLRKVFEENVANQENIRRNVLNNDTKNGVISMKKISAVAAILVATVVLSLGGYKVYATPVNYLSVDINPSVKLGINLFDKVIEIVPLNKEAKEIVDDLELKNENIEDAVSKIILEATKEGYIDEEAEDNAVLITSYSDNDKKADKIKDKVEKKVKEELDKEEVVVEIIEEKLEKKEHMTEDIKGEAQKYDISNGKMLLIKKAVDANSDFEESELAEKSVKEIMTIINDAKKEEKNETKEEKQLDKDIKKEEKKNDAANEIKKKAEEVDKELEEELDLIKEEINEEMDKEKNKEIKKKFEDEVEKIKENSKKEIKDIKKEANKKLDEIENEELFEETEEKIENIKTEFNDKTENVKEKSKKEANQVKETAKEKAKKIK